MAAVVGIVSRRGLSIDMHCGYRSNNHKLTLYKQSLHFNSCLNQLYIGNNTDRFSYKGGHGMMPIKEFKKKSWHGLHINNSGLFVT